MFLEVVAWILFPVNVKKASGCFVLNYGKGKSQTALQKKYNFECRDTLDTVLKILKLATIRKTEQLN